MAHKEMLKVIVLGDSSVGKTSLMNRYVNSKFSLKYKATIGADFLQKDLELDDKHITLQIWDTCGQERFANLGVAFYRGANAAIIVYDVSNRKSFDALDAWIENFIENASPQKVNQFPFIIFGNKCDLDESQWAVSKQEARNWCKSYNHNNGNGLPFYATSAKDDQNVDTGFMKIAKLAMQYDENVLKKSRVNMQAVDLNKKKASSGSDCKCQLL
eukprot:CAMPEP_0197056042 /NCGR_PEP_ID=MMETSP1384-20130603/77848_1 /TAXON_ID=29189 /ORGANISM="Ammonia sp." /LENGTH=214 /DNA_ID=CAMNT_0042489869 /DNA_START=7 /DNA_END=651 /DNA_ORIENTATION=-